MDRTGETKINNFGSEMIITEYENARNITVFFPKYNYITKHINNQPFLTLFFTQNLGTRKGS